MQLELNAVPCTGGGRGAALPGLQDVRGHWKGSWEAYGGGGGATSVEFGVRGENWEWGDYGLDKVTPSAATPALSRNAHASQRARCQRACRALQPPMWHRHMEHWRQGALLCLHMLPKGSLGSRLPAHAK